MAEPLVCIDCRYIRKRPSGISAVVQALVDHLPQMAPDLRFLLLKHPQAPARLSSSPNVRETVLSFAANGPATMWVLPRLADLSGVRLFHATFNIQPAGLPMPCVTTIHDVMWLKHPHWAATGLRKRLQGPFFRHGIRRALRRSTRLAAVSQATRDEIATIDPAAAARTRVTRSGVSENFRSLRSDELRLPEPLRPRAYVLTVGQYAPYKNHEAALRAFALAFGDRPDMRLAFVQRMGPGERALLPLARRLGIAERVHFLPRLQEQELVALYNGALALLHPSFYEGFGNPLAEAMACGCPVVTSNASAMPEVTGGAALLADPCDAGSFVPALRRIADEPALADRMRELGLARAHELDWRGFAAANLAIYRELL